MEIGKKQIGGEGIRREECEKGKSERRGGSDGWDKGGK